MTAARSTASRQTAARSAAARQTRFPLARNALAEVRHHPRRVIAVVVAIMISVGYLTASVTVVAGETATFERSVIARTTATDVVVTVRTADRAAQSRLAARIADVAGVASADLSFLSQGRVTGSSEYVQQQSIPANPKLRWTDLAEGHWPATPAEIVLGAVTARQLNLRVGDRITINDTNSSATLTVTGLMHEGNSLLSGLAQRSFVAPSYYTGADSIHTSQQTEILVIGDGTVAPDRLAERVTATAGGDRVETSAGFTRRVIAGRTQGVFLFQLLLLVFGAVALLVGSIMIVNTFLILVAQRRRQIGLLRAVGAHRDQIRRGLLAEATVIGAAGSLLGAGLGVALAAVVAAVLDQRLTVPAGQVTAVAVVGVAIAVLSVVVPARRAARIAPLDALRTVAGDATGRRASLLRRTGPLALIGVGLAAIGLGRTGTTYALLYSVAGSFVCAVGLLSAAGLFLPALLRALGAAVRRAGPAARLATDNTLRNPGRTAATGAALILAVGLVVALQVGAASMKATADSNLEARFPVDVTVSMFDGPLPPRTAGSIAAIDGIAGASGIRSTRVTLRGGRKPASVRALGPDATAMVMAPAGYPPIDTRVVLADPYLLTDAGIRNGTPVTVTGRSGSVTLPVRADHLAPADTLIVAPGVLSALDGAAPVGTVWARARPGADITELRSQLRTVAEPLTGAEVGGGLSAKLVYHTALDRLLALTTTLLAVAVLIALVGVGNTLGLSVLERTRESALLRALGLQRRQLRGMLAAEAALLSFAGAMAGIAAGTFFGWVGTHAVSGELNFETVRFAMSVPQTLGVAMVAVTAGVVASVLPGRRAARAMPVDALAET
ncbi:ABC transporter permease [Actinoplanes sp. NBRC 103695]|uniref:FtsX-like permease family protein n=1 Tax=Actinoplanes sp. NBRC 103695 TaxID=3032202 RepID=UPI0024A46C5C|nr:ABC transporter permease [Actinoplanes sp. NBRC 103695]GLY95103.1 ABC transporter permease [Actinoplanes sp. NBRC 103695]